VEEAGDDTKVWERLKQEEEALGKFAEAFGDGRIVNAPVTTIAKKIANEPGKPRHVDIRSPNAENMSIDERDEAMSAKIMEVVGDADSVLVIVGEDHRAGVTERLRDQNIMVGSLAFPCGYAKSSSPVTD
jgi:pheromone shutdown protein TraB